MKFVLLPFLCLLLASNALATPKITEIRLEDVPGFVLPPRIKNEFVFRADGNFYWLEGTDAMPVRHRYSIGSEEFQTLATSLEAHHFFNFKPTYGLAVDAATVEISAIRGGRTKSTENTSGLGTRDLWEVEMIIRGFASNYTGLKRAPVSVSAGSSFPVSRATPIPVIRGTQKTPN